MYDAADTGLFGDMALIGEEGVDLAMLPIGDYYTMGRRCRPRREVTQAAVRSAYPLQHLPPDHPGRQRLGGASEERDERDARRAPARGIVRDPGQEVIGPRVAFIELGPVPARDLLP